MVLVQKQTHRSVGQNRKPRNKPTHLWSNTLWQKRKDCLHNGEKTDSSINGAGKTGQLHVKEKIGTFSTPYTKIN